MESAIRPTFHKYVSSVSGGDLSKDRRSAAPSAIASGSTDGEPDREEGGVATL